ncbi:MAG: glycosyltransferase family 4 protein [Promethearchaeota archaeon]
MKFLGNKQKRINGNLRILYFTPTFAWISKTVDTYFTNEINTILKIYPNIEFLVYFVRPEKKIRVYSESERILQVNRKSYKNLLFLKDMIKIFTKFKPHVVHSHYVVPSIFVGIFAKIFRIPVILHGRGQDVNHWPYFRIKSKILLLIAGKLNNMILTVCNSMKNDCLRFKIPSKKITVIYNGIDSKQFNPVDKNFFSKSRTLELLHIGTFSRRKSQHLIIEACKLLKNKDINFHLTLIGDGPQKEEIVNLINKYDLKSKVDLLGSIDHIILQNYMAKSDLMIFPSITEGLPNAVLEAMSMQLPVVLTRVDGHIEIAQKGGSILIEKNSVDQIVDAILDYYNNPKNIELGGRVNRNFIVNNFSWDKHGKELFNIYNRIIKNKKTSKKF